jgi:hypothetical protein
MSLLGERSVAILRGGSGCRKFPVAKLRQNVKTACWRARLSKVTLSRRDLLLSRDHKGAVLPARKEYFATETKKVRGRLQSAEDELLLAWIS